MNREELRSATPPEKPIIERVFRFVIERPEGRKARRQVVYCNVIAHMLRDIITERLEGKRIGRYAIIGNNNSVSLSQFDINKNKFLPLLGKVRMGFNHLNNRKLIPTLSPFLIREGDNCVSRFTFHTSLKSKIAFTLAEGATHVALWNNQRKIAFTLAEVLITLGIIGVVAALTIPALIQSII